MSALLFALICVIWSTTWATIRIGETGFPPLWGAVIRFVLAALILRLALRRHPGGEGSVAPWVFPAAALANAISYSLIYVAERQLTGGTAAVLGATNPFFVQGCAVVLGYERLAPRRLAGLAIGFGGVCALLWSGVSVGAATAKSMAAVLFASGIMWPTYTVLLRKAADGGVPASVATSRFIGWTIPFLLVFAIVFEGKPVIHPGVASIAAVVYLAVVGTAVAWTVFNHLLSRLAMTVLSTMLFIEPALALGVDRLLGEPLPGFRAGGGAALILIGVLLAAVRFPGESLKLKTPLAA